MRSLTRVLLLMLALVCGIAMAPTQAMADATFDDATAAKIDDLIATRTAAGNATPGDLIAQLSSRLLGTPYGADMLIGSATQPEQLVIDLRRVDCFTYLDYVEAARRSGDRNQFTQNLINARYAGGQVDFLHHKHFFTDWARVDRTAATDITGSLSSGAVTLTKHLNAKGDGSTYLPTLPVVDRDITYIPSNAFTNSVISQLHTGDYLGAYADAPGLDVTHVGIFISTPNGPMFRNASSLDANMQVVDTPLTQYLNTVPGLVVLRPNS